MKIRLSPIRRGGAIVLSKSGDVLTINGEDFDFSTLPDGATIPAREVPCEWIAGTVDRLDGEICLTIQIPLGPNPSYANAFPAPIIDPPDGPIALPYDVEEPAHVDA
jgi:hypothetical protein